MAELASPESWCTGNGTVGSNPTPSAGAQVFRRRNADREEARGRLGTPTSGRHRAGARNRRLITLRSADAICAPSHRLGSSDRSAPAEDRCECGSHP